MFGERLKLARKRAGLSLRDLEERLNRQVSAQAIGKYERGDMMPGSPVLRRSPSPVRFRSRSVSAWQGGSRAGRAAAPARNSSRRRRRSRRECGKAAARGPPSIHHAGAAMS